MSIGEPNITRRTLIGAFLSILVATFFAAPGMAQDSGTVVLGGTGPAPNLQTMLDGISGALSSNGVKVKIASGDAKSRSAILEDMKTSGNTNLLYVTLNQAKGQRGKLLVECFVDGKKLWEAVSRGSPLAFSDEGEAR